MKFEDWYLNNVTNIDDTGIRGGFNSYPLPVCFSLHSNPPTSSRASCGTSLLANLGSMQSIQPTIDLAFRLLEHTLFIPSNLPLLLQGQRKQLPSSSLDPLALLQQNPVVDHLEETPVLTCIAYLCDKPFDGFGVGNGAFLITFSMNLTVIITMRKACSSNC
ncbi:hypothetical protein ACFXTH_003021 [Malus domestica]